MPLLKGMFNICLCTLLFGAGYWTRGKTEPLHQALEQIEETKSTAASLIPWL